MGCTLTTLAGVTRVLGHLPVLPHQQTTSLCCSFLGCTLEIGGQGQAEEGALREPEKPTEGWILTYYY